MLIPDPVVIPLEGPVKLIPVPDVRAVADIFNPVPLVRLLMVA